MGLHFAGAMHRMIAVVIFKAGRKVQVVRQARVLVVVLVVDILLVLHSDRGEMCERLPQTQSRWVGAMAGEKDRQYSVRVYYEASGWCTSLGGDGILLSGGR